MKYSILILNRKIARCFILLISVLFFGACDPDRDEDPSNRMAAAIYQTCNSGDNFVANNVSATYDALTGETRFGGIGGVSKEIQISMQLPPALGTFINDIDASVIYGDGSGNYYGSYNPTADASGGTISINNLVFDGNKITFLKATLKDVKLERDIGAGREIICINADFAMSL